MRAECASKRNESVAPPGQKSAKCPVTARIAPWRCRWASHFALVAADLGLGPATLRSAAKMRAVMPADGVVVRCELDEHSLEHPDDFIPPKSRCWILAHEVVLLD
jgi:hypothetical protein